MGTLDRHWKKIVVLALVASVAALLRHRPERTPEPTGEDTPTVASPSLLPTLAEATTAEPEAPFEELSEAEQHKRIDIENMRQIHAALMACKEETGNFPTDVTDLVPEFLEAKYLESPREGEGYNFEFRNTVFRDGRTWEEIKEVQRMEWGDVIPILRSFNHGENEDVVVNLSYGGVPYETLRNWEWDPNTLDVIAELGWGPGLSVGEFTEVTVTDESGQAVEGAEVWASGRHYSFDLPDRPFLTDANGVTKIPLGSDLDRTRLGLRAKTEDGRAAPAIRFPHGAPPDSAEMTLTAAQEVSGVLRSQDGEPLANTWIYLEDGGAASPLGAVKTDAQGRWQTHLAVDELTKLGARPAPAGVVGKGKPTAYVEVERALRGEAEIIYQPAER